MNTFNIVDLHMNQSLNDKWLLNINRCPPEVEFCHYQHTIWQNWMFSHGTLNLTRSLICFYVQKVKRCDRICFFRFRVKWKDTDNTGPEIDISNSRMWLKIMFWKWDFLNYSPVGNLLFIPVSKGNVEEKLVQISDTSHHELFAIEVSA